MYQKVKYVKLEREEHFLYHTDDALFKCSYVVIVHFDKKTG